VTLLRKPPRTGTKRLDWSYVPGAVAATSGQGRVPLGFPAQTGPGFKSRPPRQESLESSECAERGWKLYPSRIHDELVSAPEVNGPREASSGGGARDKPRFYIRHVDGWRAEDRVGVATRADARKLLVQAEARVAQGRGAGAGGGAAELGAADEEWIGTLPNRNAPEDRTWYQPHIKAAFEETPVRDAHEIGPVMIWIDRQRKAGISEAGGACS
jgi:hypothetical protein